MIPLVDNPVVRIEIENGVVKSITTNVSPNTRLVVTEVNAPVSDEFGTLPYPVTANVSQLLVATVN